MLKHMSNSTPKSGKWAVARSLAAGEEPSMIPVVATELLSIRTDPRHRLLPYQCSRLHKATWVPYDGTFAWAVRADLPIINHSRPDKSSPIPMPYLLSALIRRSPGNCSMRGAKGETIQRHTGTLYSHVKKADTLQYEYHPRSPWRLIPPRMAMQSPFTR